MTIANKETKKLESTSNSSAEIEKTWPPAWTGLQNRTLWDVMQFICTAAVPVVLTWWSLQQGYRADLQEKGSRERNEDNQKAALMSNYLDSMSQYLLGEPSESQNTDTADMIARARTLNTLRQLDAERKGLLLKFLYEANLVRKCQFNNVTGGVSSCQSSQLRLNEAKLDNVVFETPIAMPGIDLTKAKLVEAVLPGIDLTGALLNNADLSNANLNGAFLNHAQLSVAKLKQAKAIDANLENANLKQALLTGIDFSGANLKKAILIEANLTNAILINTNLEETDLRGANLDGADLTGANLRSAKYNDNTKFPAGFNPSGKGMRKE